MWGAGGCGLSPVLERGQPGEFLLVSPLSGLKLPVTLGAELCLGGGDPMVS